MSALEKSKPATITSSELQKKVGTILKRVAVDKERLVVEREGYPVAVLLPYPDYEHLVREEAAKKMKKLLSNAGTEFSNEEVEADVLKAVQEVRHGKRKKS